MEIRDLIYFSTMLQRMILNKEFYNEEAIRIPRPVFIVLYNGTKDMPDYYTMNLADHFLGEEKNPSLQLTVKVYNVNEGRNSELLKKCRTLREYSRFVSIVRSHMQQGPLDNETTRQILKECQEEGILTEFLHKYGTEVISMLFEEMTEEEARELSKQNGYKQGREEGLEEGIEQGIRALILDNLEQGIDVGQIYTKLQKLFNLSEEAAREKLEPYTQE